MCLYNAGECASKSIMWRATRRSIMAYTTIQHAYSQPATIIQHNNRQSSANAQYHHTPALSACSHCTHIVCAARSIKLSASVRLSVCLSQQSVATRDGTGSHFVTQRPSDPRIQRLGDPVVMNSKCRLMCEEVFSGQRIYNNHR